MTNHEPSAAEIVAYACDVGDYIAAAEACIEHAREVNPIPAASLNEREFHGLDRALRQLGWELRVHGDEVYAEDARILACPKCERPGVFHPGGWPVMHNVHCENCYDADCVGDPAEFVSSSLIGWGETEAEAIAAWNEAVEDWRAEHAEAA